MTKSYVTELPLSEPEQHPVASPESQSSSSLAAELLVRCLCGRRPETGDRRPETRNYGPRTGDRGAESVDWRGVVDAAIDRNLAPLLFNRLKQDGAEALVPAEQWERLQRAFLVSVGKSTRLQRGLGNVLQSLRDHGLPAIVLKGAYLGEAVYGDVALRPMGDVDLLIRETDLATAQAVLLEMGGVHQQFEDITASLGRRRHLPHTKIGGLVVELHWNIVSPAGPIRVDVTGLWNRACPASIAGVEALSLSPEDLLLHLCLHVCYEDSLSDLRGLVDITETTRRFTGQLDWEQLAACAREWGASRYVGLALHLARAILGADIPDKALELLVPGGIDPDMLQAARQSLLDQTGYGRWLTFFDAARAATFAEKARLSWRRVFLSRNEMAATYPKSRVGFFLPWYYGRRVVDLVDRYLTHTLRRRQLMRRDRGSDAHATLVRWLSGES
jgi:hypothetical protein